MPTYRDFRPTQLGYSMHAPSLPFRRRRQRTRGQSVVEFALVTPLLLLIFAGAADFGRAFYAYVAIENAAKEGALFGANLPLCDDAVGAACTDPNNVTWRVRAELKNQGIRNPDGSELTPTVACLTPAGVPRAQLRDCTGGDIYQVGLTYPFRLLTPILGSVIGDMNLGTASRSTVLNLAFDPTPGATIQKYVSPVGAVNQTDIVAKCLEPDDTDAAGYYRSPCKDSSTPDPTDVLTVKFEQGVTIGYRIRYGNSGAQSLSGVTITDSTGGTGCAVPGTMAVGFSQVCDYTRVAPNVTGAGITMDYDNVATIDSAQTAPATSGVRVTVEKPPAKFVVVKYVSPFALGNDGDGVATFGTISNLTVSYSTQIPTPSAWFRILVVNTGGQTATGVTITDSRGALPYGQNNANAVCDAAPTTIAAGGGWQCRYRVGFSSASPSSISNTVTATSPDVVADANDSSTAIVQVASCPSGAIGSQPDRPRRGG